MNVDGEDEDDGIRYIDLKANPVLCIFDLDVEVDQRCERAMFIIRREYDLFKQHAMARLRDPPDDTHRGRFFVTGQPGIGK